MQESSTTPKSTFYEYFGRQNKVPSMNLKNKNNYKVGSLQKGKSNGILIA